jgi:hypothetical protein
VGFASFAKLGVFRSLRVSPPTRFAVFGVTFNAVTKDAAFYTTTSRFVAWLGAFSQERQGLWLPKDVL